MPVVIEKRRAKLLGYLVLNRVIDELIDCSGVESHHSSHLSSHVR